LVTGVKVSVMTAARKNTRTNGLLTRRVNRQTKATATMPATSQMVTFSHGNVSKLSIIVDARSPA
jgi:hypothetical protein